MLSTPAGGARHPLRLCPSVLWTTILACADPPLRCNSTEGGSECGRTSPPLDFAFLAAGVRIAGRQGQRCATATPHSGQCWRPVTRPLYLALTRHLCSRGQCSNRLRGWRRLLAAAWLNCTLHEEGGCDLRLVQREKGDDSPVRTCTERNETVKHPSVIGFGMLSDLWVWEADRNPSAVLFRLRL